METAFGIPVATASNIMQVIEQSGLQRWKKVAPDLPFEDYKELDYLTDLQKTNLDKYGPRAEVVFLEDPDGREFNGFRIKNRPWVVTFGFIAGLSLVPIVVEYVHGTEDFGISLSKGLLNHPDEPLREAALREFEEETGILLSYIEPLTVKGVPTSARGMAGRFYPFLGHVTIPPMIVAQNLDEHEYIQPLLIHYTEWLKLMESCPLLDSPTITTSFLALRKLQLI